jgi:RNase P/RNase MRP subunit POP5
MMATKEARERWRYIAFRIEGDTPFARNDFLGSFLQASEGTPLHDGFRITVFEGDFGILKVRHMFKEDAIRLLSSLDTVKGIPCKIVTLKTSGTIKTLKDKYREHMPSKSTGPVG